MITRRIEHNVLEAGALAYSETHIEGTARHATMQATGDHQHYITITIRRCWFIKKFRCEILLFCCCNNPGIFTTVAMQYSRTFHPVHHHSIRPEPVDCPSGVRRSTTGACTALDRCSLAGSVQRWLDTEPSWCSSRLGGIRNQLVIYFVFYITSQYTHKTYKKQYKE